MGQYFAHKGETPGLGAEINQGFFQEPFMDKKIFNENNEFVSITVKKGGAPEGSLHAVDAISGGTITSDGVTDMLKERIGRYLPYLEKKKPIENDTTMTTNLTFQIYE